MFDSRKVIITSIKLAVGDRHKISSDEIIPLIGKPLDEIFESILPKGEWISIPQYVKNYRRHFEQRFLDEYKLFPEVKETLERIHARGDLLLVGTVKIVAYSEALLERFGINNIFHSVEGNSLKGRAKNKTEIVGRLVSRLGLLGKEGYMVGDTIHDVRAGKRFGLKTVGVTYGYGLKNKGEEREPDRVIDNFSELLQG